VVTFQPTVQIGRFRPLAGATEFLILGPPGVYAILASDDLATWQELGVMTNSLGFIRVADGTAPLAPQKFYAARLQGR
jgi:hypothetical protein